MSEPMVPLSDCGPVLTHERVLGEVDRERRRQDAKWGEQNHAATVWLTVLTEEVGELAEAILEHRAAQRGSVNKRIFEAMAAGVLDDPVKHWHTAMREEAVQVAAVAAAIVEWLDRGSPIDGTDADYVAAASFKEGS